MKDADYIYAVACIRAKEKSLLKDSDIQAMSGLKDEKAVISYLIDRGWGSHDVKESDELLRIEENKTAEVLNELGVEKSIIEVLRFRQIFHNLKTAVKQVCTGTEDPKAFYKDEVYDGEKLRRMIRDNDFGSLPEFMQKPAKTAKEIMLTTRDGQRCDSIIDRACLDATIKGFEGSKDSFLIDYAESKVAIADIRIAARACNTKKSYDFIIEALSPCRAFDVKRLARAASISRDEMTAFLKNTDFSGAADAINESFSSFEKWCDDYMICKIMDQKTNIQSSGPIVAYYLARQNEIQMARIILTAKANGFPDQTISERVRKMYG